MPNKTFIKKILKLKDGLENQSAESVLRAVLEVFGSQAVQANSLGAEDIVITHMLFQIDPRFNSFTLDTGRLNPETYELMGRLREKYHLDLEVMFPDTKAVQKMVREKGINLFYDSIENRKLCCHTRKVEPLQRVLSRYSAWICGLRKEQTPTRSGVKKIEIDAAHAGMIKVNPLADWSHADVWNYIKKNNLPYNRLHDEGYPSIGCAPCTRAVKAGEAERAGRWWWEAQETKECGLHLKGNPKKKSHTLGPKG